MAVDKKFTFSIPVISYNADVGENNGHSSSDDATFSLLDDDLSDIELLSQDSDEELIQDQHNDNMMMPDEGIQPLNQNNAKQSESEIEIDLTYLDPFWKKFTTALKNVEHQPVILMDHIHLFAQAIKDLLTRIYLKFEIDNPGKHLGQSLTLRDELIEKYLSTLSELELPTISLQMQLKVKEIVITVCDYNQLIRRGQLAGKRLSKLENDISALIANDILNSSERFLDTLVSRIVSKQEAHNATSSSKHGNPALITAFLTGLPLNTREPFEGVGQFFNNQEYYENKMLTFMHELTLYIIHHPNVKMRHDRHHEVWQLMRKAHRQLQDSQQLQIPAIDRCLILFQNALELSKGKGRLHQSIMKLAPPDFILSPNSVVGYFKQTRESRISNAIKDYKTTNRCYIYTQHHHLREVSKSTQEDIVKIKETNRIKISNIPYEAVNEYCFKRGYEKVFTENHRLLKAIGLWFSDLFTWSSPTPAKNLQLKLTQSGFSAENHYNKATRRGG